MSALAGERPAHTRLSAARRAPETTLAGLFVALLLTGWILRPGEYLVEANLQTVVNAATVPAIVALGACVGLLGGVVDLSIGSVLGLSATVFAIVLHTGSSAWLAACAALAAGLAVGAINAIVSVGAGADPIVATLGTLVGARGLTLVLDHGRSEIAFAQGWTNAVGRQLGPIPIPFLLVVAAFAAAIFFVRKTRPGRHIGASGGNAVSAERAGIRTRRIRFDLFLMTSGLSAIGGIVYAGQLGAAPAGLGLGLELQVFAAIILSGFSISRGGLGNPLGALLGVLAIAMLSNLLDITGVLSFWKDAIIGSLLIASVLLDNARRGEGFQ